jgi:signal transduction histidine kinase
LKRYLSVVPFALAFAGIAFFVDRAVGFEQQVRTAQNARADVLRLQLDQETAVRGYAATRNAIFLEPFWQSHARLDSAFTALRANVARLAPDLVSTLDDERITHWRWLNTVALPIIKNPNGKTVYSLEVAGKGLVDRFRDDDDRIANALDEAAQKSDNRARALIYAIIAVGLILGLGLFAFIVRMSDRQRLLAEELQRRNAELKAASSAKDTFLAGVSHELRTPLNSIIGFTGTLLLKLPGPLTADQENQLRIVQTNARHLLALINDILDLTKIESGKIETHFQSVDAYGLVDEVVESLRGMAEEKGLHLERNVCNGSFGVTTDARILRQILTNLLSNAIKYTESGFVRIDVNERRHDEKCWLDFTVVDSGVGIKAADQTKIFEPFERIDNVVTRRATGSGLGLYLSYRLSALLGGRLGVKSEWGEGSTFTLSLPAQEAGAHATRLPAVFPY